METICVRTKVEGQIVPSGNPFTLVAVEDLEFKAGEIVVVNTGLQIDNYSPDLQMTAKVFQRLGHLHALSCQIDMSGMLNVLVFAQQWSIIKKYVPWVRILIERNSLVPIRFIQTNEKNHRIITGESKKIDGIDTK